MDECLSQLQLVYLFNPGRVQTVTCVGIYTYTERSKYPYATSKNFEGYCIIKGQRENSKKNSRTMMGIDLKDDVRRCYNLLTTTNKTCLWDPYLDKRVSLETQSSFFFYLRFLFRKVPPSSVQFISVKRPLLRKPLEVGVRRDRSPTTRRPKVLNLYLV